jgi:quinol monooxygenase YgiN
MSAHVVMTFQAKPDRVNDLLDFLTGLQDRTIKAGALTASLMQDENDPTRILEEEVWQTTGEHKRFLKTATEAGELESLNGLLVTPLQVSYFDTVKYSHNRLR